ncbi:uncharacterized protein LOC112973280 [Apteryx rowi]|uniref:uncharacterized protein LOC112973280 n=1 Tax=Apteryx rowi TaxID=308060 RepID=UPI000E1DBCA1|nr:uncharacterized protein LOC112973280 [Apteryx rowi]
MGSVAGVPIRIAEPSSAAKLHLPGSNFANRPARQPSIWANPKSIRSACLFRGKWRYWATQKVKSKVLIGKELGMAGDDKVTMTRSARGEEGLHHPELLWLEQNQQVERQGYSICLSLESPHLDPVSSLGPPLQEASTNWRESREGKVGILVLKWSIQQNPVLNEQLCCAVSLGEQRARRQGDSALSPLKMSTSWERKYNGYRILSKTRNVWEFFFFTSILYSFPFPLSAPLLLLGIAILSANIEQEGVIRSSSVVNEVCPSLLPEQPARLQNDTETEKNAEIDWLFHKLSLFLRKVQIHR